jgi:hypothetical protein
MLPTQLTTTQSNRMSLQSIASDDSYAPDCDANVLIVSHGGAIRELLRYFNTDLGVILPGILWGMLTRDKNIVDSALRLTPNTGVCHFVCSVDTDAGKLVQHLTCFGVNVVDHLTTSSYNCDSL